MIAKLLTVFTVLLILAINASAWDWDAHKYMAEQVCNDYNCGCYDQIEEGSISPDQVFKDSINHHFYNPETCKPSDYYECPTHYDNPALAKANEWLNKSTTETGCEKWYDIGVALHYYSDRFVIWHNVQKEDYEKCHQPFESRIGYYLKEHRIHWKVQVCQESATQSDITDIYKSFESKLPAERPKSNPITGEVVNEEQPTEQVENVNIWLFVVVVIVVIVILTILILWLRKNAKE